MKVEPYERYHPHHRELHHVPKEEHADDCSYIRGIGPYACRCGAAERHLMGKRKKLPLCPHDGGTCHHNCEKRTDKEQPYCFREDHGMILTKPDRFYRENPSALVFRNAMVIAAAEMQKKLENEGKMKLSKDDSKWMVEKAGGVVTEHETNTTFDWTEETTVFVKERWADKEAVLAARTLERVLEDEDLAR